MKSEIPIKPEIRIPEIRRNAEIRLGDGFEESITAGEAEFWGTVGEALIIHEDRPPYDLEERTAKFGEQVILFAKKVPVNAVTMRLISQLVGAGTSVGANYSEADDGVSRKDFRNRIGTCRKESKETRHWLRMIATAEPDLKDEARVLWHELNRIFGSIWRKTGES